MVWVSQLLTLGPEKNYPLPVNSDVEVLATIQEVETESGEVTRMKTKVQVQVV
jgi:hypothetical protein